MRRVPLAWLQLTHEKRRFAAALVGVVFAVVLMLMQLGMRAVLYTAARRIPDHLAADLVMISPHYEYLYAVRSFSQRRLYSALAVGGVQAVAPLYLGQGAWRDPATQTEHNVFVLGVPTTSDVLDVPAVHDQLAALRVADTVLFDVGSRPEYGPIADMYRADPNLRTELNGRRVQVTGLFELGATFGAGGHLVMSDLNFCRMFHREPGLIDVGLIRLAPGADAGDVRRRLAAMLPPDVIVRTRADFANEESGYWDRRAAIGFIFDFGAVMGLFVGGIVVYQILYTDVTDHLDEYATLKALGYPDRYLFGVVLQESIALSVLGFLPGYAIAALLYVLIRKQAHVPIAMTAERAVFVLVLTLLMCAASGALAMRRLRYADPAEIF